VAVVARPVVTHTSELSTRVVTRAREKQEVHMKGDTTKAEDAKVFETVCELTRVYRVEQKPTPCAFPTLRFPTLDFFQDGSVYRGLLSLSNPPWLPQALLHDPTLHPSTEPETSPLTRPRPTADLLMALDWRSFVAVAAITTDAKSPSNAAQKAVFG